MWWKIIIFVILFAIGYFVELPTFVNSIFVIIFFIYVLRQLDRIDILAQKNDELKKELEALRNNCKSMYESIREIKNNKKNK